MNTSGVGLCGGADSIAQPEKFLAETVEILGAEACLSGQRVSRFSIPRKFGNRVWQSKLAFAARLLP